MDRATHRRVDEVEIGADRRYQTIPGMVRASAERFGEGDAIVDGEVRLSFGDVEREMMAIARSLIASGVEPGDRVALWAPNSAAWITAALGALAARAWLVPLNTRLKGEEAVYILTKTDARLLIAPEGYLGTDYFDSVRTVAPDLRCLNDTVVLPLPGESTSRGWEEFLARGHSVALERAARVAGGGTADDISDVIFTSGTTGAPKGVMLRHGTSLRGFEIFSQYFGVREDSRFLVPTPFFHCFGYKAGWMIGLMAGAVTFPLAVFNAEVVLEMIQREGITHMPGPPTMFWALLDHPRRDEYDLSSLRHAMVGAASIPAVLVHRMRDELGIDSIVAGYGLTENHALVSLTAPDDPPDVVATTVGRPLPGLQVRIVDDAYQDLPIGKEGELLVRGPFHMSGYYGDEEETSRTIIDGWLRTGDIGVLDDRGYLRITDRKKDMFIVGGFNVAPAEVEKALLGLEGVAQVAVVGMPDDYFGEVGAAFVIPKHGCSVKPDDVVSYARQHLANFKVPRRVEIVDDFPVNATGKVLKSELRKRVRAASSTAPAVGGSARAEA
jgi:acyl-CoA synthetase (AMP-forming)/AMP-acid ligase II